jgi:hypothetical protein
VPSGSSQDRRQGVTSSPATKCAPAPPEPHAGLVAKLDAGIPNHFCPFGRFFPDDGGKLGRRVADRREAKFVEACGGFFARGCSILPDGKGTPKFTPERALAKRAQAAARTRLLAEALAAEAKMRQALQIDLTELLDASRK